MPVAHDHDFDGILEALKRIHEEFPDMRFGRVLQEAIDRDKRAHNVNLFGINSKKLLSVLEQFHTDEKRKRSKA